MTMTDTGVKPIPAYVPPEDGKPRNAVDEKWMKLTRSARHYNGTQGKGPEGKPSMGLKLVIERECSRDHQTALRQFLCCEPGGPGSGDGPATLHTLHLPACARPRRGSCARFLSYPEIFPCMMTWSASANTA